MKTVLLLFFYILASVNLQAQSPKINKNKITVIHEILDITNGRENAIIGMKKTDLAENDNELLEYMLKDVDTLLELIVMILHDNFSLKELKQVLNFHKKKSPIDYELTKKLHGIKSLVAKSSGELGEQIAKNFLESKKSPAQKIFEKYPFEEAIKRLDSLIQKNSQDYNAFFYKAKCFSSKKDYVTALHWFKQCIEANPEFAEGYFLKAIVHSQLEQLSLCKQNIEKALELEPNNLEYLEYAAWVYTREGLYEKAIPIFTKIMIASEKVNYKHYISRGTAYKYDGQKDKSEEDYQEALWIINEHLEADSNNIELLLDKANAEIELDDYHAAIKTLFKGLKINDKSIYIYELLTFTYMRLDDYEMALKQIEMVIPIDTSRLVNYNQRGYCLLMLEQYDKAVEDFNYVIKKLPDYSYAFSNRGFIKIQQNDLEGAEKDILHAIELKPSNSFATKNLGLLRLKQGKKEEACNLFNTCIQNGFTELYGKEVLLLIEQNCR